MSATSSGLGGGEGRISWPARGSKAATAIVLSLVAGVAVALVGLPAVALVGLTAKGGADTFLDLPTTLRTPPLAQPSRILDAKGNLLAVLRGDEDREEVSLSHVAPVMRTAIVDIEDSRFYSHHGVDIKGTLRALVTNNENGDISQGGSTITQQYVKRVLLEQATTQAERKEATEQSVQRKLREARYALALEKVESKQQILQNYLNIVFFGDGAYGVQTASKHYFGIDVSKLNVAQAAMLAGLVQSPTAYDPLLHPKAALKRRNIVLFRMHQLHHLTDAAYQYAVKSPLGLHPAKPATDSCQSAKEAPFFCSWIRSILLNDPKFGPTQDDREQRLFEGDLTIRTSLDPVAQAAAQKAVDDTVPAGSHVAAGTILMQPGTGKILAMAVDRKYGPASDGKSAETTRDFYHTKSNMTLSQTAFSPGSTFKLFTLTAAIEQGLPLNTTFNAPACYFADPHILDGTGPTGKDCYHNAEPSEGGNYSMTTGTWGSVNTYFVQLEQKVGVLNARDMARRLGVTSPRLDSGGPGGVTSRSGTFTLGTYEASTLDMTTAYATIAAHGKRCSAMPILGISLGSKAMPYTRPGPCKQAVPAHVADTVTSILQGVITNGTGAQNGQINRPAAGKTGTAEDHSDAWFVGYVPQIAAAVTVGDPRSTFNQANKLFNVQAGSRSYSEVFGGDLPTIAWAQAMRDTLANENLPVVQFALPQDNTQPTGPPKVAVPNVVSMSLQQAEAALQAAGFQPQVAQQSESLRSPGTVLRQSPSGNSKAPQGSVVKLAISKGFGSGQPVPGAPTRAPTPNANQGNSGGNGQTQGKAPAGTLTEPTPITVGRTRQ